MSDVQAGRSLRSIVGAHADASGVVVVAAVTHDGFWIGSAQARIWVQLTGPLRSLSIQSGNRVRFGGTVVANSPSFSRQPLTSPGDIELLTRQGVHVAVSTTGISVTHRT